MNNAPLITAFAVSGFVCFLVGLYYGLRELFRVWLPAYAERRALRKRTRSARAREQHPLTTSAVETLWSRIEEAIDVQQTIDRAREARARVERIAFAMPARHPDELGLVKPTRRSAIRLDGFDVALCAPSARYTMRAHASRTLRVVGYEVIADPSAWICESARFGDEEQLLTACGLVSACEALLGTMTATAHVQIQLHLSCLAQTTPPRITLIVECAR